MNQHVASLQLLGETSLTAGQMDLLNTIRCSGETLLILITDILDFSRIEANKMVLSSFQTHTHIRLGHFCPRRAIFAHSLLEFWAKLSRASSNSNTQCKSGRIVSTAMSPVAGSALESDNCMQ